VRLITVVSLATAALASGGIGWSVAAFQPTVRASQAWIQASAAASPETIGFVTVDNGTMYDVYIVGVQTEVATIELRDTPKGATVPATVKEVSVPAFGRLEMSPHAIHLQLKGLKAPLVAGQTVQLVVHTDGGEQLSIAATVK
jgi:copper(I)-binding protein